MCKIGEYWLLFTLSCIFFGNLVSCDLINHDVYYNKFCCSSHSSKYIICHSVILTRPVEVMCDSGNQRTLLSLATGIKCQREIPIVSVAVCKRGNHKRSCWFYFFHQAQHHDVMQLSTSPLHPGNGLNWLFVFAVWCDVTESLTEAVPKQTNYTPGLPSCGHLKLYLRIE